MTDSIVDFIKTQLALDEQIARDAGSTRGGAIASWHVDCDCPDRDAGVHADDCMVCRVEGDNITIYDEGGHDEYQARHIARHDPVAVLAEIEAKRCVMARHYPATGEEPGWSSHAGACFGCGTEGEFYDPRTRRIDDCPELRDLAAPYASRPGFKPGWRLP